MIKPLRVRDASRPAGRLFRIATRKACEGTSKWRGRLIWLTESGLDLRSRYRGLTRPSFSLIPTAPCRASSMMKRSDVDINSGSVFMADSSAGRRHNDGCPSPSITLRIGGAASVVEPAQQSGIPPPRPYAPLDEWTERESNPLPADCLRWRGLWNRPGPQ